MTRPCDVGGCPHAAGLFVRVLPPVPDQLSAAVYLCTLHALIYTGVLWDRFAADVTVTAVTE